MANINHHPAPGLGEMLPGFFAVPQNPVAPATYQPSMGELLPGSFSVPQNPIVNNFRTGMQGLGSCSGTDCGSWGFTGSLGGKPGSLSGLGLFEGASQTFAGITSTLSAIPYWVWIGGGLLILFMMRPGKSAYRAELAEAQAAYTRRIAEARKKYGRLGSRVGRASTRALRALRSEE